MKYIDSGGLIKTACELFNVSRSSIQRWRSRQEQLGTISPSIRANLPYKLRVRYSNRIWMRILTLI